MSRITGRSLQQSLQIARQLSHTFASTAQVAEPVSRTGNAPLSAIDGLRQRLASGSNNFTLPSVVQYKMHSHLSCRLFLIHMLRTTSDRPQQAFTSRLPHQPNFPCPVPGPDLGEFIRIDADGSTVPAGYSVHAPHWKVGYPGSSKALAVQKILHDRIRSACSTNIPWVDSGHSSHHRRRCASLIG